MCVKEESALSKLRAVGEKPRNPHADMKSAHHLGAAGRLGDLRVRSVLLQVGQAAQARGRRRPAAYLLRTTHQDVGRSPYKLESFDIRAVFLQLHKVQINCK